MELIYLELHRRTKEIVRYGARYEEYRKVDVAYLVNLRRLVSEISKVSLKRALVFWRCLVSANDFNHWRWAADEDLGLLC